MDWKNKLYFGDNLKILREHVADASASVIPAKAGIHPGNLICLDPPFNSSGRAPVPLGAAKHPLKRASLLRTWVLAVASALCFALSVGCSRQTGAPADVRPNLRPTYLAEAKAAYKALIRTRDAVSGSETGYQLHLVNAQVALDKLQPQGAAESQLQTSLRNYHDQVALLRLAIGQRAEISRLGDPPKLARSSDEFIQSIDAGLEACQVALADLLDGASVKANPCLKQEKASKRSCR
jgi:hypothetical protein